MLGSEIDTSESNTTSTDEKHLIIVLGGELYAVQLTAVKEVLKPQTIKPVPFTVPYFKGVINLRGQVTSVIDLREKFQMKVSPGDGHFILIIDSPEGCVGAIIDELIAVHSFEQETIESNPVIESKASMSFFKGIGRYDHRLVTLIDIAGCLSSEDLRAIKKTQKAG